MAQLKSLKHPRTLRLHHPDSSWDTPMSSGLRDPQGGDLHAFRPGSSLASLGVSRIPGGITQDRSPLGPMETWELLRTSRARGSGGHRTSLTLHQLFRKALVLNHLSHQLGNPSPVGIARGSIRSPQQGHLQTVPHSISLTSALACQVLEGHYGDNVLPITVHPAE